MPMYLNHRSILQCTHGGVVMLTPPPARSFWIMASPVVTDMDLYRATIVGCPQIGPGLKPCIKIVSIMVGLSQEFFVDDERPILDSLQAMTDGVGPGVVSATTNGGSNATPAPISFQAAALRKASHAGKAFCELCSGT